MTLNPAGFLITRDYGTHDFTRIHYDDRGFRAGDRADGKIGPGVIERADLDTRKGLTVVTSRGTVFLPLGGLQASWVP